MQKWQQGANATEEENESATKFTTEHLTGINSEIIVIPSLISFVMGRRSPMVYQSNKAEDRVSAAIMLHQALEGRPTVCSWESRNDVVQ